MKINVCILFLIILISGCSSIHPIQRTKSHHDHVDLGIKENTEVQQSEPEIKKNIEETVRVGDQGGQVYATPEVVKQEQEKITKKLKIGINFGPGLNRVINYVHVLKILERQKLNPEIITGSEMGAIVAAMYAEGTTPEMIEWNFYKYFKESKNAKPYEKEWLNNVDKILLSKFTNSRLENTKKKLFITLYDHSLKKAFYFDKGNIRELLLKGLHLREKNQQKYISVFEKEVFNSYLLHQMGADFTLAIDGLGTKFDFDRPNEFLIGIYGRASGRIQLEKNSFDYITTLPLSKMNLDSSKEAPQAMKRTFDFMNKEIVLIKNKIQNKLDTQ